MNSFKTKHYNFVRNSICEQFLSKTLRDYYEKENITLSDRALASIVWNTDVPETLQLEVLQLLAEETEDEELKAEIVERTMFVHDVWDLARESTEGYVYKLELWDDESDKYETLALFSDCSVAEKIGERYGVEFRVVKQRVFGNLDEATEEAEECDFMRDEAGRLTFDEEGMIIHSWSGETRESECSLDSIGRFENSFAGLKHPFRMGDIVRCEDGHYGIVNGPKSDDEMVAEIERLRDFADFSDEVISVEYPYEDGNFTYDHEWVFTLERVNEEELPDSQKALLVAASEILKGNGMLTNLGISMEKFRAD